MRVLHFAEDSREVLDGGILFVALPKRFVAVGIILCDEGRREIPGAESAQSAFSEIGLDSGQHPQTSSRVSQYQPHSFASEHLVRTKVLNLHRDTDVRNLDDGRRVSGCLMSHDHVFTCEGVRD